MIVILRCSWACKRNTSPFSVHVTVVGNRLMLHNTCTPLLLMCASRACKQNTRPFSVHVRVVGNRLMLHNTCTPLLLMCASKAKWDCGGERAQKPLFSFALKRNPTCMHEKHFQPKNGSHTLHCNVNMSFSRLNVAVIWHVTEIFVPTNPRIKCTTAP